MIPLKSGDFVWSLFPYEQDPDTPGPVRHAACVIAAFAQRDAGKATLAPVPSHGLVVGVYTTSQTQRYGDATPVGVLRVSIDAARQGGHKVSFLVDVRKRAFMPFDKRFFPDIGKSGNGVIGPAGQQLFARIVAEYRKINERHSDLIVNLGPLRPPGR